MRPSSIRRGFTLIEMSVVIVLTAVVLGMAVTLLTSLLGVHYRSVNRAMVRTEMNRLTDALRRDLRLASGATQPNKTTLVVELPSGPPVHYVLDGTVCRRSREATQGGASQHERYAVGPALGWENVQGFNADDEPNSIRTVAIEWAPREAHQSPPSPLQIVAAPLLSYSAAN